MKLRGVFCVYSATVVLYNHHVVLDSVWTIQYDHGRLYHMITLYVNKRHDRVKDTISVQQGCRWIILREQIRCISFIVAIIIKTPVTYHKMIQILYGMKYRHRRAYSSWKYTVYTLVDLSLTTARVYTYIMLVSDFPSWQRRRSCMVVYTAR